MNGLSPKSFKGGDSIKIPKAKRNILCFVFAMCMIISGSLALADTIYTIQTTSITTTAVHIEIEDFTQDDSDESNALLLMPGDSVSFVPKIVNHGTPCYIRAKIDVKLDGKSEEIETFIGGISSSLEKRGDYYYYNNIVGENETIDIFETVKLPSNIENTYQGENLLVEVHAEAVQARNFDPSGQWNVEIEETLDRHYSISNDTEPVESIVIYQNETEKYIKNSNPFFSELARLVPGDEIKEEILIDNIDTHSKFKLDIQSKNIEGQDIDLLDKVILTLTTEDGTQLYSGSIKDYSIREIADLNSGENQKLIATISLPAELGNEYALKKASILWIYYGEYEGKENPDIIDPEQDEPSEVINLPLTGDIKTECYLVLFIISTIGLFSTLAINNKKENLEER